MEGSEFNRTTDGAMSELWHWMGVLIWVGGYWAPPVCREGSWEGAGTASPGQGHCEWILITSDSVPEGEARNFVGFLFFRGAHIGAQGLFLALYSGFTLRGWCSGDHLGSKDQTWGAMYKVSTHVFYYHSGSSNFFFMGMKVSIDAQNQTTT